ncbi:MAG: serine protease [Oligoflexia bacterium]|nr:serine protease [Oligoflexia bacterium]
MKNFFLLPRLVLLLLLLLPLLLAHSSFAKDKIVGGEDINSPGYFVSLVDSYTNSDNKTEYYPFCGGSLIYNDGVYIVATAAHCVPDLSKKLLVAMRPSNLSEINQEGLVEVKAVIVHPQYNRSNITNDIALLLLDETSPLLKNKEITTIPIYDNTEAIRDRKLVSIGFGNVSSYGNLFLTQMQSVTLYEHPLSECQASGDFYRSVSEKQICADNNNLGKQDSCFGDSGGPLIVESSKKVAYLIGLVSWGMDCAQIGSPGVYTRLASYKNWIDQQILLLKDADRENYSSAEIGILSLAYCYANNPRRKDFAVEDEMSKMQSEFFLLSNASYQSIPSLPESEEIKIPLDTCSFTLPNGRPVERAVSLKSNREQTGYEYEYILRAGDHLFQAISPLLLEYKISCNKNDGTAAFISNLNQQNALELFILGQERKFLRYHSSGELLAALPPDAIEEQSCNFHNSEIKIYSQKDSSGQKLFAKLAGPNFSSSYNHYYELQAAALSEPEKLEMVISIDKENPLQGKITLKNHLNVDLHSWQLRCLNLQFALAAQSELRNFSEHFLVLKSPFASINKGESLTLNASFDQKLSKLSADDLSKISCRINQQEVILKYE